MHNVPKSGSIPLMGARLDGEDKSKFMELSYNSEKKWRVLCGGRTTEEHSRTWEPETTYQVAIVLQNGTQGFVYVDGKRVCGSVQRKIGNYGFEKDITLLHWRGWWQHRKPGRRF
ncbi:trans-sialidase, putative, partial [Trypanosoma cruzi marinkellei]